jgi:hypothetical protein
MLHLDGASAGDARFEQDKRAVRVDGESLGEFLERLSLRIRAFNPNGNLHQNALAADRRPESRRS